MTVAGSDAGAPAVRRVFLGWQGPALERVCGHVLDRSAPDSLGVVDLSRTLLVVPGARTGRVLRALLAHEAARRGLGFSPGRFLTGSDLVPALVAPSGPCAGTIERQSAWILALRRSSREAIEHVFGTGRGARDGGFVNAARMLVELSDELAAQMVWFEDAARLPADSVGPLHARTWSALAELQRRYELVLTESGLVDGPLDAARQLRDSGGRPSGLDVVLVGVTELSTAARRALGCAASATSLVLAPESLSDRFDCEGCIVESGWHEKAVQLGDTAIEFADDPGDAARRVVSAMARETSDAAGASVHDFVLCVPESTLMGAVRRGVERSCGVTVHTPVGMRLSMTRPGRLLRSAVEYRRSRSVGALGEVLRHPDLQGVVANQRLIEQFDECAAEQLPTAAGPEWPTESSRGGAPLRASVASVDAMTEGAHESPARALEFLFAVYGRRDADPSKPEERRLVQACQGVRGLLDEARLSALRGSVGTEGLLGPAEESRLIVRELEQRVVPEEPSPDALEVVGWLDVALDPAPVAIVAGVNEKAIPFPSSRSPLLSHALRRLLGLGTESSRAARDAYLLSLMAASKRRLVLIAVRTSADGDPMAPSRLLFWADDGEAYRRISRWVRRGAEAGAAGEPDRGSAAAPGVVVARKSLFGGLPVEELPIPDTLVVTAFGDYLTSPYLFYLKHVARLREFRAVKPEMTRAAFGDLMHRALRAFGVSGAKDSTDPKEVAREVVGQLRALARETYGAWPSAAVQLQIEAGARRLGLFAEWQAARARAGWSIEKVEWSPASPVAFSLAPMADDPGLAEPIHLLGKVDRIDVRRDEDGRVVEAAVLDYKTADREKSPEQAHRRNGDWRNLQLPLYRHLIAELALPARVALGYINLSSSPGQGGLLSAADWSEADLRSADRCAASVVRKVRAREFQEAGDPPFAEGAIRALLGLDLLGEEDEDEDGGAG